VGTPDADADVDRAWNTTRGDPGTVIAVIDSGIDLTHPDLAGRLWTNPDEIAANDTDDDGNGHVDDLHGWDFIGSPPLGDAMPQDTNGHGTAVAGVATATADDGAGIAGVCPLCSLMVLRIWSDDPGTALELRADEVAALDYAVDEGADIVVLSLGVGVWSSEERAAVKRATSAGVLVVAAAGNFGKDNDAVRWVGGEPEAPRFPASYDLPGLMAVAASDDRDRFDPDTNTGHTSVDLAAPGREIATDALGGGCLVTGGTSFAAPFVAGVAGLVQSAHPGYDGVQLQNAILNGVDTPGDLARRTATGGRVNALAAIGAPTSTAVPVGDGVKRGARSMGSDGSVTGRLAAVVDVNDIYRMQLRSGHRYTVTLRPESGDFDLFVWKPGATDTWPIAESGEPSTLEGFHANRTPGGREQLTFTAGQTGVYRFHVTRYSGGGRYRLTVVEV
jgi:subtilisin family serine protease